MAVVVRESASAKQLRNFRRVIWNYYRRYERNFPWRKTGDPYKILVSEIMLQQTQVSRVLRKYHLFLRQFPNFRVLARAPHRNILAAWQGLGYNRRALALKRMSGIVVEKYGGKLPRNREILEHLPGVGRGTAGAVMAFAFNLRAPFIETNIRRVFINFFFQKKRKVSDNEIMPLVERALEGKNPRAWYWALMDYGAMLGRSRENPNRKSAAYRCQSPFRGSLRELRGKIVALLIRERPLTTSRLARMLGERPRRVLIALQALAREGFLHEHRNDKKDVIISIHGETEAILQL